MQDFMISITGPKGSGKTALMGIIFGALADRGLLSMSDTVSITKAPAHFLRESLIFDTQQCEQFEIEICPVSLTEHILATATKQ